MTLRLFFKDFFFVGVNFILQNLKKLQTTLLMINEKVFWSIFHLKEIIRPTEAPISRQINKH